MKIAIKLILGIVAIITMQSCASIVSKTKYNIPINTYPQGATITVTNKKGKEIYTGKTPSTVTVKSGAGYFTKAWYEVKLEMDGYDAQIIPIEFDLNAWYFGNIILGGYIGMLIVDPVTGAMWKIKTGSINAILNKKVVATEPTLQIIDIVSVPDSMKDKLEKIR